MVLLAVLGYQIPESTQNVDIAWNCDDDDVTWHASGRITEATGEDSLSPVHPVQQTTY
jgi:hypothetical protein